MPARQGILHSKNSYHLPEIDLLVMGRYWPLAVSLGQRWHWVPQSPSSTHLAVYSLLRADLWLRLAFPLPGPWLPYPCHRGLRTGRPSGPSGPSSDDHSWAAVDKIAGPQMAAPSSIGTMMIKSVKIHQFISLLGPVALHLRPAEFKTRSCTKKM